MSIFKREDLRRVVFSDLSEQCDDVLLYELCVQFGPVSSIIWPSLTTLSGTSQRQNFCFVDFRCAEDAKYCYEALYRSQVRLFNKELRVSHASVDLAMKETGGRRGLQGLHEVGAKVLVRNVDPNALEVTITSFFEQFGPFAAAPRMRRDSLGNFRGTVVLSYKDFASSDRVIAQMDQQVFRDRTLSVQYAPMEDGSDRLHGTQEERENAELIRAEEAKYQEKLFHEAAEAQKEARRARELNTSWADNVRVYERRH